MKEVIHIECKVKELPQILKELAEEMAKLGIHTIGEYRDYLGRVN